MNMFSKSVICIVCSTSIMLLDGCAFGGGSTDVSNVDASQVISGGVEHKGPTYKVTKQKYDSQDFTEMGYSQLAPVKNQHKEDAVVVDVAQEMSYSRSLDTVNIAGNPISIVIENDKWKHLEDNAQDLYPIGQIGKGHIKLYIDNTNYTTYLKLYSLDHVQVGLIKITDPQINAAVFYYGKDKTQDMPVGGTIVYEGTWTFAHQIHRMDFGNDSVAVGELTNDSSKLVLTVNFGDKSVKGSFTTKQDPVTITYTVDATVHGNSFGGTAKGHYNFKDSGEGDGEAVITGSFFGPGAAEIAGRIEGTKGEFTGTFGAAATSKTDLKIDGTQYSSVVMPFEKDGNLTRLSQAQATNFSGSLDKLQVNGLVLPLTDEMKCCSQLHLENATFGTYDDRDKRHDSHGGYYVQGYTTANSEIPTKGKASYQGLWSGYGIASDKSAVFSKKDMAAKFTADWDEKKLSGQLFNDNQSVDNSNAPITISAKVENNTFSGTAQIKDLVIDTSKATLSSDKITADANVSGHFFGPSANELGGMLETADHRFGGVFGAKEIANTEDKGK